jgi:phospholipid-translocating ATPase
VKFTSTLGLELVSRDSSRVKIKHRLRTLEFEILNVFPFSSERKRMGIVLKEVGSSDKIFYIKGADVVMKPLVRETSRGFIDEECENLAREGLRTLVVGSRVVKAAEYERFRQSFERANESMDERERKIEKAIGYLERNIELLGITGVEDKL